MSLIDCLRSIRGYVELEIEGNREKIDQVLSYCLNNNILIWDIKKLNKVVLFKAYARSLSEIEAYCHNLGIQAKIKKETGFNKYFCRYKKRLGISLGIAMSFLLVYIFSSTIWEININGNEKVSTEAILSYLEEGGIKVGKTAKNINTRLLADDITINCKDIDWIGINIIGCKVNVSVKETTDSMEIASKEPCNIVANKDGLIINIEAYDGLAVVKNGDIVKKGDLLVSGIVSDKREHTYLRSSSAKVMAKTYEKKTFEFKLKDEELVPTNEVIRNKYIILFGRPIPFFNNKKIDDNKEGYEFEENKALEFWKVKLPFFIKTINFNVAERQIVTFSEEEAKESIEAEIFKYEYEKSKDAKILNKRAIARKENDTFIYEVNYIFEENIAKKQKILQNN